MAPKPRGLKASKLKQSTPTVIEPTSIVSQGDKRKATQLDDNAEPSSSTPSTVAINTDENPTERTMPLDHDFLSVQDMFELRDSILKALSLLDDPNTTQDIYQEQHLQIQNLSRGILHGCDALKQKLNKTEQDTVELEQTLNALGLDELGQTWIAYLEAWALHHMAFVVDVDIDNGSYRLKPRGVQSTMDQEQGQNHNQSGSNKRRKVDDNEPKRPQDWLDKSIDMFEEATSSLMNEQAGVTNVDKNVVKFATLLIDSDELKCVIDRIDLTLSRDQDQNSPDKLTILVEQIKRGVPNFNQVNKLDWEQLASFERAYDDPFKSYVETVRSFNRLIEQHDDLSIDRMQTLTNLDSTLQNLLMLVNDSKITEENEDVTNKRNQIDFSIQHVKIDTLLIKFQMIVEDEIYARYRPENLEAVKAARLQADDNEDEQDDEDEDQDEASMTPLPTDASDVQQARQTGQSIIEEIRNLLKQTNQVAVWDRKRVNLDLLTKLEEALQMYSALFNVGSEDDKLKQIEQDIESVHQQVDSN
ncbi:hypothetical protein OIO90_004988 [Microbotryomycetes sp. JL221]|nr:hypothetical protein OIO90_004988 [Microbotryomycetes sp. JL221]